MATMTTVRLTGEHGHVVLVGLAQGVVDDAVLIRKTLEDVHADLQTDGQTLNTLSPPDE